MHISYKAHDFKAKGTSSKGVMEYLTKEDINRETARFFNHDGNDFTLEEASKGIDDNKGSHGNNVSKFYILNVSPSKKELQHLDDLATDFSKKTILADYSKDQLKQMYFESLMQEYTKSVMEHYAENFNREKTVDDLVYYAKVEYKRTYKIYDADVKHNYKIDKGIEENPDQKDELILLYKRNSENEIIRENMQKDGLNAHIHVVVSRYEKHGSAKEKASLSPMSKGMKSTGFHNSQVGFSRDAMSEKAELQFDEMFVYQRTQNESYEEFKNQKNREKENYSPKSSIRFELERYTKNTVLDILESNHVIDRTIPTSLNDLKNKLEFQIKKDSGLHDALHPTRQITGEYSKLIDYSDKGIDTGY